MRKLLPILIIFFCLILFFILTQSVLAVNLTSPFGNIAPGAGGVYDVIGKVIKAVLAFTGSFALLMFVYGGFTLLTSGGSDEKIKKGRDILIWAIIGLITILSSYILVDFVLKALRVVSSTAN